MSIHRIKYSEPFKALLRKEYSEGINGYKKLAHKYHISRDAVRAIILLEGRRAASKQKIFDSLDFSDKDKEIEYWKTVAMRTESAYHELMKKTEVTVAKDKSYEQS